MSPSRPATNERRAIIALFVMFALMVQALIPTMAMAASADGRMILCTAGGTETLSADGKTDAPAPHHGAPCQDCLAAAVVAAEPPPVLAVLPAAYAVARVERTAPARSVAPRARAPPRPLGQGPPTSLQTA
jgi:hypothetical protein